MFMQKAEEILKQLGHNEFMTSEGGFIVGKKAYFCHKMRARNIEMKINQMLM